MNERTNPPTNQWYVWLKVKQKEEPKMKSRNKKKKMHGILSHRNFVIDQVINNGRFQSIAFKANIWYIRFGQLDRNKRKICLKIIQLRMGMGLGLGLEGRGQFQVSCLTTICKWNVLPFIGNDKCGTLTTWTWQFMRQFENVYCTFSIHKNTHDKYIYTCSVDMHTYTHGMSGGL